MCGWGLWTDRVSISSPGLALPIFFNNNNNNNNNNGVNAVKNCSIKKKNLSTLLEKWQAMGNI